MLKKLLLKFFYCQVLFSIHIYLFIYTGCEHRDVNSRPESLVQLAGYVIMILGVPIYFFCLCLPFTGYYAMSCIPVGKKNTLSFSLSPVPDPILPVCMVMIWPLTPSVFHYTCDLGPKI